MVAYLFLPLAHVLARVTQMVALAVGGTIVFWRGDPKQIVAELAEARPTHFPSVPRIFEKIHTAVLGDVEEQGRLKRAVFAWALAEGRRARARAAGRQAGRARSRAGATSSPTASCCPRSAALFGDNLRLALTGAAADRRRDHRVLRRLRRARARGLRAHRDVRRLDAQHGRASSASGPSGGRCPTTQVRVAADGELLLRGPHVFAGYYRNEQATSESLIDGWLYTGDLGSVDDDGFVRITGRKKELIITSSGKNISPTNIEELLRETRWISQAVVFGDNKPYLVALLTLDADEAVKLAEHAGRRPRRSRGALVAPGGPCRAADRGRRRQRAARADRADQALRDPRPRPQPARR